MPVIDYILAVCATLLAAETIVVGLVFIFTYGRTRTPLSLYLGVGQFGVACSAASLALVRWEYGLPCTPPSVVWMRLVAVLACAVLVTYSSVKIIGLLKQVKVKQ